MSPWPDGQPVSPTTISDAMTGELCRKKMRMNAHPTRKAVTSKQETITTRLWAIQIYVVGWRPVVEKCQAMDNEVE